MEERITRGKAIRLKCLDCCCGSRKLVDECRDKECRLWKHRRGLAGQQEAMFAPDDLPGQMDIYDIFKQEVFG